MKHKLTVLACIGLALLLASQVAFAQNTVTVVGGVVNRCTGGPVSIRVSNANALGAIGLPLAVSGGVTMSGPVAGPALAGFTTAFGGFPGSTGVLNAVGGNLAPGAAQLIWTINVVPSNNPPVCGAPGSNDISVPWNGAAVNRQLIASDPDGAGNFTIDTAFFAPAGAFVLGSAGCCAAPSPGFNAGSFSSPDVLTYSYVSGLGSVSPTGMYSYTPACANKGANVVVFRVTDVCGLSVDCSFNLNVIESAPICGSNANVSVDWAAGVVNKQLNSSDPNGDAITYSLISVVPGGGPAASLSASGLFNWATTCASVGTHTVNFRVKDGCDSTDCSFQVTVTNAAPVITCPGNQFAILGDLVSGTATAIDPAGNPLLFDLLSFTPLEGQGAPTNAPSVSSGGAFSWQTSSATNDDAGRWEVCVRVTDGCGLADTCCFEVDILSYALCVRSDLDSVNTHILSGQIATVYVTLSNTYPLGGIDLLLCYDVSGLSFLDAFAVDELDDWEYFTWRHSPASNCQGSCPSGYVRVIAIADLDNGSLLHPPDASFYLDGRIVGLNFVVTTDRNFINQCLNVGFCVLNCGDNALSSKSGDTLFIPIGSDESCIDTTKQTARDIIEFCPGTICIDEPPDDRGDINLNGLANEVGDAVLFTNYFVYGPSVWDPVWEDVQILATDINNDGIVLTVADLIYLIRIITGDEQPFPPGTGTGSPKLSPYANSGTATVRVENNSVNVSTSSNVEIGGALLVFRYNGLSTGEPTLLSGAAGMNMRYNASGNELRVLVHPSWNGELAAIGAGNREIVSIPTSGDGSIELVEVQMSDARGALMSTSSAKAVVPTEYALQQNYPNPFNAGTVMSFDLVKDADWTLTIYNVAGQTVREFNGRNGVGSVRVAWDGNTEAGMSASSGVYFYRVTANGFKATKKMTLVK